MGLFCIMFNSDDKHMDPNKLLELLHHNLRKISAVIITIIMLKEYLKQINIQNRTLRKVRYIIVGMQS